jgi:hypothetical protein
MNFRYLKILMTILAFIFATQGCAVFVRDRGHHHRYRHWDGPGHRWKHYSSLQQSPQSTAQFVSQDVKDSGHTRQ